MSERPTRAEGAALRADLAASHERSESVKAQVLIDEFVTEAVRRGLEPEPLQATLIGTSTVVRTDKMGWYLKENKSVAIGTGGEYYILVVPGGLMERIRGARLEASLPQLVVSRGGRDGETGDLKFFLKRYLDHHH